MKEIKVKKFRKDLPDFKMLDVGDWIDLHVSEGCISENSEELITNKQKNFEDEFNSNEYLWYNKGDILILKLGVAIELPTNHEAEIRPRSGTFKKTGLILTNSVGTIDEAYKGDNDQWQAMFYATRDGNISRFDRLVQFKIEEKMEKPKVIYVDKLENKDRSGYGSTGR